MIVNNQWKRCTTFQPSNRMIFFYSFIFLFLVTQFLQVKASLSPRLFIQPFNNIRWHKVIRAKIITLDSSSSSALTLPCTRRRNRGNSPWLRPSPSRHSQLKTGTSQKFDNFRSISSCINNRRFHHRTRGT